MRNEIMDAHTGQTTEEEAAEEDVHWDDPIFVASKTWGQLTQPLEVDEVGKGVSVI
jgi:hypothetical protein